MTMPHERPRAIVQTKELSKVVGMAEYALVYQKQRVRFERSI